MMGAMRVRSLCRPWPIVFALAVLSSLALPSAQVRTGPSPEMRALLDGLSAALNGSADAFEAFAVTRFSPALLEQRGAAERRRMFERLRADFGTITVAGVMRGGPSAPIEVRVSGSTGMSGVIVLDVEESATPRITGFSVDVDGTGGGNRGDAAAPVHGKMTDDELRQALDGYFAKLTADQAFSGVALVARDDAPVFHKAYGLANHASRASNTPATRFNIGSINKIFTQVAIHQLVGDGRIALTDTLGAFFPDYPHAASRAATVEQLLTHRAGIADFFGPEFSAAPKDRFRSNADYFRFVSALPPLFAPGTRSQYSNGCYITLGAIVEKVSGRPYEQFVAERIFTPAGMTRTGYPRSDTPDADVAIGYTRRDGGALQSNVSMHGVAGSAAGGGYSTAEDLLSFVKAVRAGRFPGVDAGLGIGGGAPGVNAVVEAGRPWTVIVLANLDPPAAESVGSAVMQALRR